MVRQGRERKMHASHALPFSFTHEQRDVLTPHHGVDASLGIGLEVIFCEVPTHSSTHTGGKLKIANKHKTCQMWMLQPCMLQGRTSPLKFLLVPLRFSMPFKSPTLFSSSAQNVGGRTDGPAIKSGVCVSNLFPSDP